MLISLLWYVAATTEVRSEFRFAFVDSDEKFLNSLSSEKVFNALTGHII